MPKFCSECGKELSEQTNFCTNCGAVVNPNVNYVSNNYSGYNSSGIPNLELEKYNVMSVVGAIVSVVSLLINFWGLVGIVATVLSVVGFMQIQKTKEKGYALAIAGIGIGCFSILYGFITLVYLGI